MKNLQLLTIFLTIAAVQCLSVNMLKNIKNWQKQCIDETGIDPVSTKNAMLNHQYPNNGEFKKFILCLTKKSGIVDEQGNIHPEKFKSVLIDEGQSDSAAEKIVKKCAIVKGSSEDTAFNTFICYQKIAPKELQV